MHEPICEVVLENLCTAVQKVQEEFALGHDVIRDGSPVNLLCQSVDEIFRNGLKEGILSWASNSETTYWPLVVKITYKEVTQDIISRRSLKTDKERCMVWVRIAALENSLGSYLNIITQDEKILREFYQPQAFLFDKVKVDTAKTALLYGLSHLDFNISVGIPDYEELESHSGTASLIRANSSKTNGYNIPHVTTSSLSTSYLHSPSPTKLKDGRKKKKKKKSTVVLIADSLEDSDSILTPVERYMYVSSSINAESDSTTQSALRDNDANLDSVSDSPRFDSTKKDLVQDLIKDISDSNDNSVEDKTPGVGSLQKRRHHYSHDGQQTEKKDSDSQTTSEQAGSPVENRMAEINLNVDNKTSGTKLRSGDNERIKSPGDMGAESSSGGKDIKNAQQGDGAEKENQNFEVKEINDEYDYQVSCARFEFGTPTETSFEECNENSVDGASPQEDEDLNFVPGIHKNNAWTSRSSSFSSLTGSGSFSQPRSTAEKTHRNCNTDSTKSGSTSGSLPNESWKYVSSSLSGLARKDSKADDTSVATEDSFSDLGIFEELLGIDEDHFSSPPESFMGFTSSEELQHAIRSCKDMIKSAAPKSLERKKLVERLVQLRVKLHDNQEESSFDKIPDAKKILGHQFAKEQDVRPTNQLCDRCGKWIWTLWQSLFTCQACTFHSHRKCLETIRRPCASRKVCVSTYNLGIAPEYGLNAQHYKCIECRKRISLTKSEFGEARLCDYSGQFFCEDCHWNDQMLIPARIIHNWDFTTHKVSRQTKQFLDLMAKKPLLNLEELNPALFKFVGELREIKRLREEILIMKKYFMSCRSALESKLLLHLQGRQHFVDNSSNYSLQDVIEVERGTMLPFITRVHSLFLTHIKSDCELCRAKGFVCELCKSNEIIFAFDPHAKQCAKCRTVFHKLCFKKDSCPKCERIQKRAPK